MTALGAFDDLLGQTISGVMFDSSEGLTLRFANGAYLKMMDAIARERILVMRPAVAVGHRVHLLRVPEPSNGQHYMLDVERDEIGIVTRIRRAEDNEELAAVAFKHGMMWVRTADLEVLPK